MVAVFAAFMVVSTTPASAEPRTATPAAERGPFAGIEDVAPGAVFVRPGDARAGATGLFSCRADPDGTTCAGYEVPPGKAACVDLLRLEAAVNYQIRTVDGQVLSRGTLTREDLEKTRDIRLWPNYGRNERNVYLVLFDRGSPDRNTLVRGDATICSP
jgi:hypothetical protein